MRATWQSTQYDQHHAHTYTDTYTIIRQLHTCVCRYSSTTNRISVIFHLHCPPAQGYNDNSGLGPIVAQYLQDKSDQGQILILIINQLGDYQMKAYFKSTENIDGMMCEGEANMDKVFNMFLSLFSRDQHCNRPRPRSCCCSRCRSATGARHRPAP